MRPDIDSLIIRGPYSAQIVTKKRITEGFLVCKIKLIVKNKKQRFNSLKKN